MFRKSAVPQHPKAFHEFLTPCGQATIKPTWFDFSRKPDSPACWLLLLVKPCRSSRRGTGASPVYLGGTWSRNERFRPPIVMLIVVSPGTRPPWLLTAAGHTPHAATAARDGHMINPSSESSRPANLL